MRVYLQEFMESYDYPAQAVETLLAAYDEVCGREDFCAMVATYERDRFCDYAAFLRQCKGIARDTGIHTYTIEFLLFLCLSRKLREYYKENGLEEAMWRQSMLDLKCKLMVCWSVKRIWGSFVAWWFDGFFRLERFGMGRLQFELIDFPLDAFEADGKVLRKGDKVINVHIPKTGESLRKDLVEDAYRQAAEFFRKDFGDRPMAFFCESWLTFPEMDRLLPARSNIRDFKDRFTILHSHLYEKGDYSEMWRLFDMDYTGSLADFPADSSLRRAYRQYLMEGGQVGEGYGVFFWVYDA